MQTVMSEVKTNVNCRFKINTWNQFATPFFISSDTMVAEIIWEE